MTGRFRVTLSDKFPEASQPDDLGQRNACSWQRFKEYINTRVKTPDDISGDKLMEIFFPLHHYHFFISHSSADVRKAIYISRKLQEKKLTSFIDSQVWLRFDQMLGEIVNQNRITDSATVLRLASHANIMLGVSLMKMISRCDYFIFLESGNSVQQRGAFFKTYSPWIMLELQASALLPVEFHPLIPVMESFNISYLAQLEHLKHISGNEFTKWLEGDGDLNMLNNLPVSRRTPIY